MRRHLPIVVALILAAGPAAALDIPERKAGLWEIKMVFEGRDLPPHTAQNCIDAATDKMMNSVGGGMTKDVCSKQDVQKSGVTMTVDSVCNFGAGTTTTHAVISGSFNSAYTIKVASKTEGASPAMQRANPSGQSNMTIEAKWIGPCKADQKPGDVIMANGVKMNVLDLPNAPGAPPPKR